MTSDPYKLRWCTEPLDEIGVSLYSTDYDGRVFHLGFMLDKGMAEYVCHLHNLAIGVELCNH